MEWNGEAVVSAIAGAGGAWMVGAALTHRGGNFNIVQRRGLFLSGMGFLVNTASARWMQGYGKVGIACSLLGSMLAVAGIFVLLKERSERRAAQQSDSRE